MPRARRATVLGPGDSFGEMSLLTGAERSADVRAVTPLVLFEIGAEELVPLLARRPALTEALSGAAAAHEEANARLRQLPGPPATLPSRVAQIAARIRAVFRL
jgi:CRP-like cAMP-binding protein